jgi:hypothetical protein
MSNFSPISWGEHATFEWVDDNIGFVLNQYDELDFCSGSSLKYQYTV